MTDAVEEQSISRVSWLLLAVATLTLAAALAFALTRSDLSADAGGAQGADTAAGPAGQPADLSALEAAVEAGPDDVQAWVALGEARFVAGNFQAAADAFRRATVLAPAVAAHHSSLGEALVRASRVESIPAPALAAFRRAIALDRRDPRARYFLAVKRDLDGDHAGAIADWLALLADTPRGAPWELSLRQIIQQVAERNNIDVAARLAAVRQPEGAGAAGGMAGPSPADAEAIAALPQREQERMIAQMLARLETSLRQNPQQPDRWIMLIRSRMMLGEGDRALDALRAAIAANPDQAARIRQEAQRLGVPGA